MSEGVRRVVIVVLCVLAVGFAYVNQFTHVLHGGGSDRARYERVDDGDEDAEWDYVIPAGTAAGEEVDLVPNHLEVEVGETIRIENRDTEDHALGPWSVGAGETVTQRFTSAGEVTGECDVCASGQLHVEVRD